MSFSTLHLIEAQLIAQLLDVASLLLFARCDRFTLQAASSTFAFLHQPPFTVCSLEPNLPSLLCHSLLRYARVHLEWVDAKSAKAEDPPGFDELLASMSPLHSLTITSLDFDVSRFTLDNDALQPLRCLRLLFPSRETRVYPPSLPIFPALQELELECSWPAAGLLSSLSQLPQLTALSLTLLGSFGSEVADESIAAEVGCCVSLRRLSLSGFLHPSLELALTERMHQLEDFTLTHKRGDRYSAETLAWIRRPPKLRSLSLLGLPIGLSLVLLVRALADTLSPDGPMRRLLFLPLPPGSLAVAELTEALTRLIARAPSIERIAFEPYRYRLLTVKESTRLGLPEYHMIQHRAARQLYVWKGLPELHAEHLAQLPTLVAADPTRICVAPVSQLLSAEERMEQLWRRYAKRPSAISTCESVA